MRFNKMFFGPRTDIFNGPKHAVTQKLFVRKSGAVRNAQYTVSTYIGYQRSVLPGTSVLHHYPHSRVGRCYSTYKNEENGTSNSTKSSIVKDREHESKEEKKICSRDQSILRFRDETPDSLSTAALEENPQIRPRDGNLRSEDLRMPDFSELVRHEGRVAGKMSQPPPHAQYLEENLARFERWKSEDNRNYQYKLVKASWRAATLAAFFCVGLGMTALWWLHHNRRPFRTKLGEDAVGKPDVGGPWTLVDQTGRFRSSEEFKGRYQLIYFGFTFCPDVCPQEMEKQARVCELVGKHYGDDNLLTPLFISVDPSRDTVAQLDMYCREFSPKLIGLTGTPVRHHDTAFAYVKRKVEEMIKKVSRLFRVYYNPGIRTDDEDYLVDHSIILYLMDRQGKFLDFFGKNTTALEVYSKIIRHLDADRERDRERRRLSSGRWFRDKKPPKTWNQSLDHQQPRGFWDRLILQGRTIIGMDVIAPTGVSETSKQATTASSKSKEWGRSEEAM